VYKYLIDGYNLLFKIHAAGDTLKEKRDRIIKALNQKAELYHLNLSIVFDGKQRDPLESVRRHLSHLEIIYTAENESADAYILSFLSTTPVQGLIVITSDLQLKEQCALLGAQTQTIEEFLIALERKKKRKEQKKTSAGSFVESPSELLRLLEIFEKKLGEPDQE